MCEFYEDSNGKVFIIDGEGVQQSYYEQLRKSYPSNAKTVYSDRLHQWDSEKFNRLFLEIFGGTGQYFYGYSNKDVEKFLSLYLGEEVELLCKEPVINVSNGYPYWRFDYVEKEN